MHAKIFLCGTTSTVVNIKLPGTTPEEFMAVVELLAPMEGQGLLGVVPTGKELNAIAAVPVRGISVEMAPGSTAEQARVFVGTLAERADMTVQSIEEVTLTVKELRAWWAKQQ